MDILQSRVIADGTIRNRVGAAKMLSPVDNADKLAVAIYNIDKENKRLKQDSFESDLKLKQAEFNEQLSTIENDGDFQAAIDKHNKEIDDLGNSILGEKEYKKWQKQKGRNYKQYADLGYKSIWLKRKQKENYALLQNNADKAAVEASMIPSQETMIDKNIYGDIDGATGLTREQKENLKNRYLAQKSQAQVLKDIRTNPENALYKLQKTEEEKNEKGETIKVPAMYKGLDAIQRQRYIEAAKRQYEAELNTYQDKKLNTLKQEFNDLYENNGYKAAADYAEEVIKKANTIVGKGKNNISQEQFQSFKSYANSMLREQNSQYAIENNDKYGNLQVAYNKFDIKKNKKGVLEIKNKELNNVESIVEVINDIDNGIKDKTYFTHQNDVIKKRAVLQELLGNMVDKKVKLRNWNMFSDTVSEYISDSIASKILTKDNKHFEVNKLTPQQKGQIYEHIYKTAIAANIDLASINTSDKQTIDKITTAYFDWYVKHLTKAPDKNYSGIVGNDTVYTLDDDKADNNIGKKSLGYGRYTIDKNGNKRLIDKDGNIIDEVR